MKISYEDLLYLFEHNKDHVDETVFYFDDDPEEAEHYIGYIPEFKGEIVDNPYWIGLCDIETVEGRVFATAKELFEAKVFGGKSIKERWEHVVVFQIGGFGAEDFIEMYGEDILRNRKRVDE